MKRITCFFTAFLLALICFGQADRKAITDSISAKVIHYLQMKQPDSIYALTGKLFRSQLTAENFRNTMLNQLLPIVDFKDVQFVSTTNGINKYKVAAAQELQLLIGLDQEKKLETLLIQAFVADKQDDPVPAFLTDSLDRYVERALADWQIPGAAVCVVKNGKVVVMKGYGVTEAGTTNKVDENTLFMIGSNTKAFTATALALLSSQYKMSLDDKVTRWIPQFRLQNKAAGEQAIVRDLLCHRLGFMTFQGDFTYWTSNLSREAVIEKMSHIKASYPFRTTWGYTNAAFLTAGQIIPAVTGMPWEAFITKNLFEPLGMTRTLALSADYPKATNKCEPYTLKDGQLVKIPYCMIDNLAPAGSISSSVNDLSHWVTMQLNNGLYNNNRIVPAPVLQETRLPHSILGNGGTMFNRGHFSLYGLGWQLEEYESRKIVSHTGGVNGFVTSVTLLPEEQLGILVLTNTDQNDFYEALKWEIVDACLKLPYRNYSKVFLQYTRTRQSRENRTDSLMKDSVNMHRAAALPLAAYAGDYASDLYGDMKVALEGQELRMRFSHHPHMYAKLEALGGNRFYAVFSDPEFGKAIFPFTTQGSSVQSVTVKVADFVEITPYEFRKKTGR